MHDTKTILALTYVAMTVAYITIYLIFKGRGL
jgi:hypothetical protein